MTDFNPPTASTFSYTDEATGVVMVANYDSARGLSVSRSDSGPGSDNCGFMGKTVPSGGTWSAKMRMETALSINGQYARFLFAVHDSVSHGTLGVGVNHQSSAIDLFVLYMSNLTTWSSTPYNQQINGAAPTWFRIDWDGTNYLFYVSLDDNITWTLLETLAAASYFTATHIGVVLENSGSLSLPPTVNLTYYGEP